MCTTEELTKIEHPTECPTPIGTPTDCLDDCWSPGVDDVDCPTGTVVIRYTLVSHIEMVETKWL